MARVLRLDLLGIWFLSGLGAVSGCRTPAHSTTVSAVESRHDIEAGSDAAAESTEAPAAAGSEETGVTEEAQRENRTDGRDAPCDSALRHLLQGQKASELSEFSDLNEVLFHRAETAVECAEREPALRADALKALVLEGKAGDTVPEAWIAAARRWMDGPAPDPSVVHFLAMQGDASVVPLLWALIKEDPAFYLSAGYIHTPEAFEMLKSGVRSFDPRIRALAASAIQGQGEQACDVLAEAVSAEIDAAALAAEIFALAYVPCPGADEIAVRYAAHSDADVRMASAAVLARVPDLKHVELLFTLLEDKDNLVVRTAAVAFRNLPLRKEWVDGLVRRAEQGKNEDIAVSAVAAAAALGTKASRKAVKRLLKGWARNNADVLLGAVVAEGQGTSLLTLDALRTAAERGTADTAEACVADSTCEQLMVEAMLALARHGDKKSKTIFIHNAKSTVGDELRAAAAWARWRTTDSPVERIEIPFERDREEYGSSLARTVSGKFRDEDEKKETADGEGPQARVSVLGPGTEAPILRVESLSDDGVLGRSLLVSSVDGDALMPLVALDFAERVQDIPLAELHNFERSRPIKVSMKTSKGIFRTVVPPVRSYILINLLGLEIGGARLRLFSREEVLSTQSDYWGIAVFNNIASGTASVDIPDF